MGIQKVQQKLSKKRTKFDASDYDRNMLARRIDSADKGINAIDILDYTEYLMRTRASDEILMKFFTAIHENKKLFAKLGGEHLAYLFFMIRPIQKYLADKPDLLFIYLSAFKKNGDAKDFYYSVLVGSDHVKHAAINHPELLSDFTIDDLTSLLEREKDIESEQRLLDYILTRDISSRMIYLIYMSREKALSTEKIMKLIMHNHRSELQNKDVLIEVMNNAHARRQLARDSKLYGEALEKYYIKDIFLSASMTDAVPLIDQLALNVEWKSRNINAKTIELLYHNFPDVFSEVIFQSTPLLQTADIFMLYYLLFEHDKYLQKFIKTDLPATVIERFQRELDAYSIASLFIKHPEYGKKVLSSKDHPWLAALDGPSIKRLKSANHEFEQIITKSAQLSALEATSKISHEKTSLVDKMAHRLFDSKRDFHQSELIHKTHLLPEDGACSGFVLDALRSHMNHHKEIDYTYAKKVHHALLQPLQKVRDRSYVHRVQYYQYKWNDPKHKPERKQLCGGSDVEKFCEDVIKLVLDKSMENIIISSTRHLMALVPKMEHGRVVKLLFIDPNGGEVNLGSGVKDHAEMAKQLARHLMKYKDKDNQYNFLGYSINAKFFEKPEELRRKVHSHNMPRRSP